MTKPTNLHCNCTVTLRILSSTSHQCHLLSPSFSAWCIC